MLRGISKITNTSKALSSEPEILYSITECTSAIEYNFHRRASLAVAVFLVLSILVAGCADKKAAAGGADLIISYSDDLAGEIVEELLKERGPGLGLTDNKDLGDCCGSYAQTALAAGEVDVCLMCPDAYENMEVSRDRYRVLGAIIYGGDVLVISPEVKGFPVTIGYMNRRERQREVLTAYIEESGFRVNESGGVKLQPMFPSALAFALECGYMDAIYVDALTAMDLQLPVTVLDSDYGNSIMVVSEAVYEDVNKKEKLEAFITELNKRLRSYSDEDKLYDFIRRHTELGNADKKEVLEFWKSMSVRFGYLD